MSEDSIRYDCIQTCTYAYMYRKFVLPLLSIMEIPTVWATVHKGGGGWLEERKKKRGRGGEILLCIIMIMRGVSGKCAGRHGIPDG